jgi:hypothetical protein
MNIITHKEPLAAKAKNEKIKSDFTSLYNEIFYFSKSMHILLKLN